MGSKVGEAEKMISSVEKQRATGDIAGRAKRTRERERRYEMKSAAEQTQR